MRQMWEESMTKRIAKWLINLEQKELEVTSKFTIATRILSCNTTKGCIEIYRLAMRETTISTKNTMKIVFL
jgi:hypothetical protein